MKHIYSLILPVIATALSFFNAAAQTLEADDYCNIKKASPKSIKEMRPMKDGLSYTAISDDGKSIDVYSYKTGQKTSTIFCFDAILGDVKISEFSGYKISDNEKVILLWNDTKQVYRYSFFAQYYVYDIGRKTMKQVSTGGRQRGATLSHDGRMVAYQRDNNIFISNLDYGTDNAITTDGEINAIINGTPDWVYEEEFGVLNTIRWSADDNTLVYIRFDERNVPVYSFDDYRSYCDDDPEGDLYPATFSYKYPLPGYPNSIVSVKSYDLNTRKTKTMDLPMREDDYIPVAEFAEGSSDRLLVGVLNRDQNRYQLYSVNPASTVAHLIYTEQSEAWLSPSSYMMAEYGEQGFIIGSERTGYRHLYSYDYAGNLQSTLTKGDFNVTAYYGKDPRTGARYMQTTSLGAINRNVAKVDNKGVLTLLNNTPGWESASFSTTFDYYVRTWSDANTPTQYTLCSTKNKNVIELEMNREYASRYSNIAVKEFLKIPNEAGQPMDAYVLKPADFNASKQYPLMMWQYNGPESQEVRNRWAIDGLYYIASQGYVVACVDGRGTGGRERSWATAVYKQLGKYETLDQLAGVRELAKQNYIDSERLACFGWSYGGYMTLMEMSAEGAPFKCGVSMAPVTDWRFYDSIYTERFMLTPGQNEAGYELASALNKTDSLSGRLLIMSGTSDDNVHFYNTLKYTSRLNYEGIVYDMMALTGFEHSLRMCNARTMLYTKIVDFLDSRLR